MAGLKRRMIIMRSVEEVLNMLELDYDKNELKKKEANIEKYFKVKEEKQNKIRDLMNKEYLMEVQ